METIDDFWFFNEKPEQRLCTWAEEYIELHNLIEHEVIPLLPQDEDVPHEYKRELKKRVFELARKNGISEDGLGQYAAWHMLIGSTPSTRQEKFGDLHGVLSIRAMVRSDIDNLVEEWLLMTGR